MPAQAIPGVLHVPGQPRFLNAALMAPNVFECDMPDAIIDELAPLAIETRRMEEKGARYTLSNGVRLYNERPSGWSSDICWLSHADEPAYDWFEDVFHRSGVGPMIAPFVPHDREIRLYAGFFVTRSSCSALNMHCDWLTQDNQAFTLMAPLTANTGGLGLTYESVRNERPTLTYRLGKGIVFGTDFRHSTAIGELDERAVFLCFTFGTDRMEHWPQIARTAAMQCDFLRQPDGTFLRYAEWRAQNAKTPDEGSLY